jgi:hypothetical protein
MTAAFPERLPATGRSQRWRSVPGTQQQTMLKLFVLGERSGDPADWSQWRSRTLVLAESLEAALAMDDSQSIGCEVDMTKCGVLMHEQPRGGF